MCRFSVFFYQPRITIYWLQKDWHKLNEMGSVWIEELLLLLNLFVFSNSISSKSSPGQSLGENPTSVIRKIWSGAPKTSGSIRNFDPEEFWETLYFDPDKNYGKKLYQEIIRSLQLVIRKEISLIRRKMSVFRMTEVGRREREMKNVQLFNSFVPGIPFPFPRFSFPLPQPLLPYVSGPWKSRKSGEQFELREHTFFYRNQLI